MDGRTAAANYLWEHCRNVVRVRYRFTDGKVHMFDLDGNYQGLCKNQDGDFPAVPKNLRGKIRTGG